MTRQRLIRPHELVLLENLLRSGIDTLDVLAASLDLPVDVLERSLRPALSEWPHAIGRRAPSVSLATDLRQVLGLEDA